MIKQAILNLDGKPKHPHSYKRRVFIEY